MQKDNYQIIIHFLKGKLSTQEKKSLIQWRKANPENEQQFQEVKFLWQKAGLAKKKKAALKIDVNAALTKVQQQLPPTAKVIPFRSRLLKYVSAASVLLVLGLVTWMNLFPKTEMIQVATIANETKQIKLPDNSTVWLNENSTISYPKTFAKATRKVKMKGDIIFEVTHNPQQPFIVTTGDLAVKVLGTKFNVQSGIAKKIPATVHVINGKVQVQKIDNLTEKVLLTKDMTAQLNQGQLGLTNTFASNQLFWATKTLVFIDTPLNEVITDLNQAYKIKVISTNKDLLNCLLTGTFKDKTLDEVLATLQLIYDFDIEKINSHSTQLNKGTCN